MCSPDDGSARASREVDRGPRRPSGPGARILLVVLLATLVLIVALPRRDGDRKPPELQSEQWDRLLARMEPRTPAAPEHAASNRGGEARDETDTPSTPYTRTGTEEAAGGRQNRTPRSLPEPQRPSPEVVSAQLAAYTAPRPKSILEIQPFRHTSVIEVDGPGGRAATATLINLNPTTNVRYLLQLVDASTGVTATFDFTNVDPRGQVLRIRSDYPLGLLIEEGEIRIRCDLWSPTAPMPLERARTVAAPYVALCDDRVVLRQRTAGRRTTMEAVTDFLRDRIRGGEQITAFVRETLFEDAYLITGETEHDAAPSEAGHGPAEGPAPAQVAAEHENHLVEPTDLGLAFESEPPGRMIVGRWYRERDNPGVLVSAIQPGILASDVLTSHTDVVAPLDQVELGAMVYLVAFDLARYEIGFALGTDHPRVGWSDRVYAERRPAGMPGPDGFDTVEPLVSTGILSPYLVPRVAATFTGGFKRTHGAFRYGELAFVNGGSHYGFVESGVISSKLQPGLATMFVLDDGSFHMRTWRPEDEELLPRIRHARQNGVPIIESSPDTGVGVPGALVSRYGAGNWSGSQDGRYRTLRAGACLLETDSRQFLVYGYFSSATPSAMARVFQAYGCKYGMLLDMNALEHTYLAVYALRADQIAVHHLVTGMSVLDQVVGDRLLPRFLGYADNRDFFYVLRRQREDSAGEISP